MLPWVVLLGLLLLLFLNSVVIRKILKVERRSFLTDYINEQHRKMNRYIKIIFIVIIIVVTFSSAWLKVSAYSYGIIGLLFITTLEGLYIYMLYHHGSNPKEWLATLQELIILVLFMIDVIYYAIT